MGRAHSKGLRKRKPPLPPELKNRCIPSITAAMSYPHAMHFYGPWQLEALSRLTVDADGRVVEDPLDPPTRARVKLVRESQGAWLPDWGGVLGQDFFGRVRYRRSFGKPSQLDADERALLTTIGVDPIGEVILNGQHLGVTRGYGCEDRFDVTGLLERRNELTIEITAPPRGKASATPRPGRENTPGGLLAAARLEIVRQHRIEQLAVCVDQQQQLQVAGQIKSAKTEAPLEVIVIVGGREAGRVVVHPNSNLVWSGKLEEVPRWQPGSEEKQGLPIQVQLHASGSPVWQTERKVAWSDQGTTFEPELEPATMWMIYPNEFYEAMNAAGIPIVQKVPTAWRDEVCARLAHHSSITAWSATGEEISQLPAERREHGTCGRGWIERET